MKAKKLFICLFVFSLFLTSCSSKTKDDSNVETAKEEEKTIENVTFDEEIKNVEIPKNATEFRFLNYNPDNDKLYYTYTSEGNTVYVSKNLKDNTTDIIYEIKGNEKENMFAIAKDGIIDETLFIVKVNNKNVANNKRNSKNEKEVFEYNFIVVDKDKKIQKYFNEDEVSMSGDNQWYNKIPSVTINGRNLILTCENNVGKDTLKSYLLKFNIDDASLRLLKEEELNTENDKLNGNYIMFAGGLENEIYYQVINYQNDDKMEKGSADIFKLISENESKKVLELGKVKTPENVKNRKVLFISGDDKLLFTSDYVIEASNYNTGRVFNLKTMENSEIPNVESAHDLTDAYKINNLYLLDNNDNIYVYNSEGKLLLQKKYEDKEKVVSKISVTKDYISYLVRENENSEKGELHMLKLKGK